MWLDNLSRYKLFPERITTLDIALLIRQFATLLNANITLMHSIDTLEKCQTKLSIKQMLLQIRRHLASGNYLSVALKAFPIYFDRITLQLIEIGEHAGKLEVMLTAIANRQEKSHTLRRKLQNAFIYPCILIISSIAMLIAMIFCIIPKFASLYAETHAKLPLFSQLVFSVSDYLQYFIFFTPILILLIFIANKYQYLPSAKQLLSQSSFYKKITIAYFMRNLAYTVSAGLPLIEALQLSSGNLMQPIQQNRLTNDIKNGTSLNMAMQMNAHLPPLCIQMIKIGEESGKLDEMLHQCADMLESEIDHMISVFSQLLEPLIMLGLGILIGGLVIAMYLPIFKLGTLF